MAQLIVRNLDDGVVRTLKMRAAANNRSAEAEHRAILEKTLGDSSPNAPDAGEDWRRFAEAAAALRVRYAHDGDSTDIIRDSRDRRRA